MRKKSDKYIKIIAWSEEDECYVGRCPDIMMVGVHGNDEVEVYRELSQAVDEWVEIHEEDGIPLPKPSIAKEFGGKFSLEIDRSLHRKLAFHAMEKGDSLHNYCGKILAKYG